MNFEENSYSVCENGSALVCVKIIYLPTGGLGHNVTMNLTLSTEANGIYTHHFTYIYIIYIYRESV